MSQLRENHKILISLHLKVLLSAELISRLLHSHCSVCHVIEGLEMKLGTRAFYVGR